jgi:hypothetical protein
MLGRRCWRGAQSAWITLDPCVGNNGPGVADIPSMNDQQGISVERLAERNQAHRDSNPADPRPAVAPALAEPLTRGNPSPMKSKPSRVRRVRSRKARAAAVITPISIARTTGRAPASGFQSSPEGRRSSQASGGHPEWARRSKEIGTVDVAGGGREVASASRIWTDGDALCPMAKTGDGLRAGYPECSRRPGPGTCRRVLSTMTPLH